jgi:hypothetical protein
MGVETVHPDHEGRRARLGAFAVEALKGSVVERAILGFHQDDQGDWVADLACGHRQHVRHRSPWTLRPWVTTPEGRAAHVGQRLDCKLCDAPPSSGPGTGGRPE